MFTRYTPSATAPAPEQRTTNDLAAFARALISVLDGTNIDLSYDPATGVISATITGTVAVANGGTGLTSYAQGDVPYASAANVLAALSIGTADRVLTSSGTAPQWSQRIASGALPTSSFTWDIGSGQELIFTRSFRPGSFNCTGTTRLASTNTSQLLSFWGATAVARQAAFTQTYSTADRTLGAYTPDSESVAYTGAADGEAKLVDLNALRVAYENLRAFTEDLAQHHNALLDDLQLYGLAG